MARGRLLTILAVAGAMLLAATVRAQPPHAAEPGETPAVNEQRRQNTFTAGVLLLIGVTTVGLLLIAAAVLWGAKVRRMARTPLPRSSRQDDLWHLRKSAAPADPDEIESDPPASPQEQNNLPET